MEIKKSSVLTCKDPELGRDDEDLEYLETQFPGKLPVIDGYRVLLKTAWDMMARLVADLVA